MLNALQAVDTAGGPPPGPHNYFRGGDVMTIYGEEARRSVDALAETIDVEAAHEVLDAAADAPVSAEPVWVHGDIAVGNLLVHDGRLSAVIDFGCCAVGDPACDLVLAWLFLEGPRARGIPTVGGGGRCDVGAGARLGAVEGGARPRQRVVDQSGRGDPEGGDPGGHRGA